MIYGPPEREATACWECAGPRPVHGWEIALCGAPLCSSDECEAEHLRHCTECRQIAAELEAA